MSAPLVRSVLKITFRHGIWRVWLDGAFYGDYRSKSLAVEGAEEKKRILARDGRPSDIVVAIA